MATTYTEHLQIPKHSPTDPFDITLINEMADKTEAGILKAYRGGAAYNLLDNSYFLNPVNQREQTSYTATGYTLDRWHQNNAGTVTQSDNGVTITPTASTSYFFRQFLSDETVERITGKTVTIACCTSDGMVYSATGTIPSEPGQFQSMARNIATNWRMMFYRAEGGSCQIRFLPTTASAGQLGLKWAALYEGSYTTDTLPAYLPKGYGVELAECQRYYIKTGGHGFGYAASTTAARINIPVPTTMRVVPSIDSGLSFRLLRNKASITVTGYSVNAVRPGIVQLTFTAEGLTQFEHLIAYCTTEGGFGLSADL